MSKKKAAGLGFFVLFALLLMAASSAGGPKAGCTTIQDGTLLTTSGDVITTGYDEWGYNYQAHQFVGYFGNYQRPPEPVDWGERLMMKWNDAWLSNMDCDDDGLLDRHDGYDTYIGSGAWLTNHQAGEYTDGEGNICKWNYFVKIVAAPDGATVDSGVWYAEDGTRIGEVIWGSFAVIQEVSSDQCDPNWKYSSHEPRPGLGDW